MLETLKNRVIEIAALLVSLLALQTSCSNQEYVEASYHNAQKVVVISETIPHMSQVVKLRTVSGEKHLLSAEIVYPEEFLTSKDYVSGDGLFELDHELVTKLKADLKFKNVQEVKKQSVGIPIKLHVRYAAQGDVYDNSFIYALVFHLEIEPAETKAELANIKIESFEFERLLSFPDSFLFMAWTMMFGLDETYDINHMFKEGVTWSSLTSPGRL
ncbi:TPA: hypothetical protein RQK15_004287 [Vibrio vulnificus]|nr:hypothetical protein [Vibrio vulnificus]